jgi:hypothetical protein
MKTSLLPWRTLAAALAFIVGLACADPALAARRPVPPPLRTCDESLKPTGLHLAEWMRLGGPAGPMGCPVSRLMLHDSQHPEQGGYVVFQNGQVSTSPTVWERGVAGVYQDWNEIVVDWTVSWDEPSPPSHFNYDKFLVRWDRNGENVDQVDVFADMAADQLIMLKYKDDTHLRTKGTFRIRPTGDGIHTVRIEGCDLASRINPLSTSTCRQGWLHPLSLMFRFDAAAGAPPSGHLPMNQFGGLDLGKIQPAGSVAQAHAGFDDRTAAALLLNACGLLPHSGYRNEENYGLMLHAKLAYADYFDTDHCPGREVNNRDEAVASLLRQHVESKTGTTIDRIPGLYRTGEYDALLAQYVAIASRHASALGPQALDHLLSELLNQRGPLDESQLTIPGFTPETENHVMLIESARYLTNQLLFARSPGAADFDNSRNGMDEWMLRHLQHFLQTDFIEYNARPYQDYTMAALINLATFASDQSPSSRRVKLAARMVLDYLSAKVAVSSNEVRRSVPYRRRVSHNAPGLMEGASDPQTPFFMMYTGLTQRAPAPIVTPNFGYEWQWAGLGDYRLPDLILDLFVTPSHRSFTQAFHHAADEIYASSPAYLLSAGGHYATFAYRAAGIAGSHEDIGLALPTTLMPTGQFISRNDLLRFEGDAADDQRSNMCVAVDFACGLNPVIPPSYTEGRAPGCVRSQGPWTFFNQSGGCVPAGTIGHYIAFFSRDGFGMLEAFDLSTHAPLSFDDFVAGVLDRVAATSHNGGAANTYMTTSGHRIDFSASLQIVAVDGHSTGAPGSTLAWGTVLNSEEDHGLVVIDNPTTRDRLVLDFRDALNPVRTLLAAPVVPRRKAWVPLDRLLH